MGMIVGLYTLSDLNIARVLRDPPLIWQVIAADDPHSGGQEAPAGLAGTLSSFFRKLRGPPAPLALGPGEVKSTDLDKAWNGLHYLFTGIAEGGRGPLSFLVSGGSRVGNVVVGYGPARVFDSEQVAAIHAAVCSLDDLTLQARFNPEEMARQGVYPSELWCHPLVVVRPGEDDDSQSENPLPYLMEYLGQLRQFLSHAAERGLGLVLTIE